LGSDSGEKHVRKLTILPVRHVESVEERKEVWSEMIEQRKMNKELKLSQTVNKLWNEHKNFIKVMVESFNTAQDEGKKDDKKKPVKK